MLYTLVSSVTLLVGAVLTLLCVIHAPKGHRGVGRGVAVFLFLPSIVGLSVVGVVALWRLVDP